ncbi:MAG: DUF6629 family protein [Actinomycetota bacterium]
MCFSPEADLVTGMAIMAIGVDSMAHVRNRREISLASLPLLLGAHTLVETFVWWSHSGQVSTGTGRLATVTYLVLAFCVLPILVPTGVIGIEPSSRGRRRMLPFLALGAGVSVALGYFLALGPVSVSAERFYLAYEVPMKAGGLIVALYVVATCVPLLLSGYRHVVVFGAVNLAAAATFAALLSAGFISIWCVWAALASGAIALHLRLTQHDRGTARTHVSFLPQIRPG